MSRFTEEYQIAAGIVPVNLATAANNGDWVSMKLYDQCVVVVFLDNGAAGEPPTVTLKQATDVSGTSAKALNFTRIDVKNGADITAIGTFTKTTQAAGNTYAKAAGDTESIIVIEVNGQDLDKANGFDCVQVSIPDVGATAQLGAALYILGGARYAQQTLPSAIAD